MLNKFVIGALAAGAIAVPLAGTASAQTGDSTAGNTGGTVTTQSQGGIGANGLPGRIGAHYGTTTTGTLTPPQVLGSLVDQARTAGQSLPQFLRTNLQSPVRSPGQIISSITHGSYPSLSVKAGGNVSGGVDTR